MRVVSFMGGIPAGNNNPAKPAMLRNFAQGVNLAGDTAQIHEGMEYVECDVAVLQGFVHENSKNVPHLKFRKRILDLAPHTVIIDSNMFSYATGKEFNNSELLRFSFDGVFPNTGNYCNSDVNTDEHWQRLKNNYKSLELHPYTNKGKHILICLQRDGGWSMRGESVMTWLEKTINTIRQHSERKIRIRTHPGTKMWWNTQNGRQIANKFNVEVSHPDKPLVDDLHKCWTMVVKNSSPSTAALMHGIPIFATDPEYCQAGELANTDLSKIENPNRPDRERWLWKLCASHWNMNEIRSGACWSHMRKYV